MGLYDAIFTTHIEFTSTSVEMKWEYCLFNLVINAFFFTARIIQGSPSRNSSSIGQNKGYRRPTLLHPFDYRLFLT